MMKNNIIKHLLLYIWFLNLTISGVGIIIGCKNVTHPFASGYEIYEAFMISIFLFATSLYIITRYIITSLIQRS